MDADDVTGSDATVDEMVGELVGAVVELGVGERLVGEGDCGRGRGAVGLVGDESVHADVRGRSRRGVVYGGLVSSARSGR